MLLKCIGFVEGSCFWVDGQVFWSSFISNMKLARGGKMKMRIWMVTAAMILTGCGASQTESQEQYGAESGARAWSFVREQDAAQPLQSDVNDKCRATGEGRFASASPYYCGGIWNVYASIKGGGTWWNDKVGEDSDAQMIEAQALQIVADLKQCGITAHATLSDFFVSFTPDLVVVHSAPLADARLATRELGRAKACGLKGYSKASRFEFAGRD
jgi:hypothetical protein